MTKATLAAMMLGTTIGSQYVDAAEPTDDNDNKSSESSKASMPVKVDDSKINKAVEIDKLPISIECPSDFCAVNIFLNCLSDSPIRT